MKITKMVVTDEHGIEHEFEGTKGFVQVTSAQEKTPGMAKITGKQVLANLFIPKED
jgi:hypothetical protein